MRFQVLHLALLLQEWEQMSGSSGDDTAERGTNLLFKSLLPVPSQIPKRSMPFLGQSHPLLVAHTDDSASAGSALFPALLLCGSATLGWFEKDSSILGLGFLICPVCSSLLTDHSESQ